MAAASKDKNEYLLAAILKRYQTGDNFNKWPPHITIIPWVRPNSFDRFIDGLKKIVGKIAILEIEVGQTSNFGPIPINLIQEPDVLFRLHQKLLAYVKKQSIFTRSNKFTGENYIPHITKHPPEVVQEGQRIKIDRLYLISAPKDKDPRNRLKTIVKVMELATK